MKMYAQMPSTTLSNLSNVPLPDKAGTWGVCRGGGVIAAIIRKATDSWAGHAVMYVGEGKVIQARWPRVQISDAPTSDVMWATEQPLTDQQRMRITARAHELVGDGYDILVYPFLALAALHVLATNDVSFLFAEDRWRDCSGLVEDCDYTAGVPMFPGPIPNFITPAMLMTLGTHNGWFKTT